MAYGPNSDSALTMGGYSLWNQAGRFPTEACFKMYFFLKLNTIPLYVYTTLFNSFLVDEYLASTFGYYE